SARPCHRGAQALIAVLRELAAFGWLPDRNPTGFLCPAVPPGGWDQRRRGGGRPGACSVAISFVVASDEAALVASRGGCAFSGIAGGCPDRIPAFGRTPGQGPCRCQ